MGGQPLKLVVGLGNPGPEYARTRHNAGYWYVDELARRGTGGWRRESRHQCELARVRGGRMRAVADEAHHLHEPQWCGGAFGDRLLPDRARASAGRAR